MHVELSVEDEIKNDVEENNSEPSSGSQVACVSTPAIKIGSARNESESLQMIYVSMASIGVIVALYVSLVLLL